MVCNSPSQPLDMYFHSAGREALGRCSFNSREPSMKKILIFALLISTIPAQAEDYAAWKLVNKDAEWTRISKITVKHTNLINLIPKDIDKFCPNYQNLNSDEKAKFWVGLISIVTKPESNFDPRQTYTEKTIFDKNGKNVVSRGLLQISQESANAYGCNIQQEKDLHKPEINLNCGAKILSKLVTKDQVIGTYGPKTNKSTGGGRYWSVLRERKGHFPLITGFTNKLDVCKAKL